MRKLRGIFLGNIWLKIISLIIAFFIWMMVSNADNPTRTVLFTNVPITIVNEDAVADIGKVIEPEGSGTVTLRVTEKRSVLQTLSKTGSDFYVEADMDDLNDSLYNELYAVPLTVTCSNSAVTWDEIDISPSSMKVTIEDKVESTYVASVLTEGSPVSGYEVGESTIEEGKNIVIAGPQSLMKIINQVVAPVNVGGLEEDDTLESTLKVYDKNGDLFTDTQLTSLEFKDEDGNVLTDHIVNVKIDLWRIVTDVSVEVATTGTPAWGYRVSEITMIPETISVAGTEEALAELGTEFDSSLSIDVSDASEDVTEELDLTESFVNTNGLKLISGLDPTIQVTVVIEASGDVTLLVSLSDITFYNRPSGMNLVVTPADQVSVKVHALTEDMDKLTTDDLVLSVDLSECSEEGTYELPVEVELPEGYELATDITLKVVSTLQEVQTEGE